MSTVVIGAGAVGLAISRALARRGHQVVIVEAAGAIGTKTSGRNSEVIHGGMYYDHASLKATCCVNGRRMLYEYCDEYGVPYNRCGKLIVSTNSADDHKLWDIQEKSLVNGLTLPRERLIPMTAAEAMEMEPNLKCTAALFSPDTGVVDSHAYMLSLLGDAERHGAVLAVNTPFLGATVQDSGEFVVRTGGVEPSEFECEVLVNSAGLGAQDVARAIQHAPVQGGPQGVVAPERIPPMYYAKGSYFKIAGKSPFGTLVYPLPNEVGLGVHLTVDTHGQAKFGPDVEWVDDPEDYRVDERRGDSFYEEVRKYWPDLRDGDLKADYSGIRPKTVPRGHGGAKQDFIVDGPEQHGVQGLVHLFGIESPGLTSSLALADIVATKLQSGLGKR